MKKHDKHPPVARQKQGYWGRNEIAFVGTDCNSIKEFCSEVVRHFSETHNSIYIDASHNELEKEHYASSQIIQEGDLFSHLSLPLENKLQRNTYLNPYDLILINGNHHQANTQVVFLQKEKENSIRKRIEQLDNILMFISKDGTQPWDFIKLGNEHCPVFSSDDKANIYKTLEDHLFSQIPIIKGLVLAGGKSSRMGEDKGGIKYHQVDQREYLKNLLENNQIETYISCRADQMEELSHLPLIIDDFHNAGPMGAILSALKSDPNAAWLVIAVDMPYITNIEIKQLINERAIKHFATCYHNESTDFPEPLFTIFEPKAYLAMMQTFALGYACPRKFLINHSVKSIKTTSQDFLKNINTPEEKNNWKK